MTQSSKSHEGRILTPADEASWAAAVERAWHVLASGGLIAYPTETVYGIGADARNADAIRRIPVVKGRDDRKPILVLVGSTVAVREFAADVPDVAKELMRVYWPGPLTLVLRARREVSDLLTAGSGTVGLRCSPHPFCAALIRRSGMAITSTSANRAGGSTPGTIDEIARELGDGIELYVDAGPLRGRLPSTVVDVSGPAPRLIREGAIRGGELLPFLQGA
jgi:L-threonylcarbamoyladenylate synthase